MRKGIIIIIVLMSFTQNLFSQDENAIGKSLEIHTMPLTIIGPSPRLRLGIEYNVGKKLGYSIEIGAGKSFLNNGFAYGWSVGKDYSFFEIRPEIKYYFLKATDNYSSLYFATELFYMTKYDVQADDFYYPKNTYSIIKFKKATYRKVKYGIHIKGGIKQLLFKRFDIDLYGGIGVAYKIIDYSNVVNPLYNDGKETEHILNLNKQIGESTIIHVTLGCKIGWLLFIK
jgi:hypothetical protein